MKSEKPSTCSTRMVLAQSTRPTFRPSDCHSLPQKIVQWLVGVSVWNILGVSWFHISKNWRENLQKPPMKLGENRGFHILTVDFSTHRVPHLLRIAQGRAKGRHEISGLRDKESHHLPDDRRPGSRWSIWPVLQTILGTKLALRLLKYTKVLIQVLSQVL